MGLLECEHLGEPPVDAPGHIACDLDVLPLVGPNREQFWSVEQDVSRRKPATDLPRPALR